MYHRPIVTSTRFPELIENLKAEFETLAHDVTVYKNQRDEYERKLTAQLQEMANLSQQILELERAQQKLKQQYEEEILRLRRQLESLSGGTLNPSVTSFSSSSVAISTPRNLPVSTDKGSTSTSMMTSTSASAPTSTPASTTTTTTTSVITTAPAVLPSTTTSTIASSFTSSAVTTSGTPTSSSTIAASSSSSSSSSTTTTASASSSNGFLPVSTSLMSSPFAAAIQSRTKIGLSTPSQTPALSSSSSSSSSSVSPVSSIPSTSSSTHSSSSVSSSVVSTIPTSSTSLNTVGYPNLNNPLLINHNVSFSSANPVGTVATTLTPMEVDIPSSKPRSRGDDSLSSGDLTHDWVIGFNPAVPRQLDIDLAHTLEHDSVVCCVKFSADGKFLATGYNHCACIYDVETGKKIQTFVDESHKGGDLYIRSVCFSPDGRYLVTGAEDKTIKVWDIERKVIRHDLQGHDLDIYSLDFSSNGQFIVSGSGDRKVKIWNVETGKCIFTLGNEEVGPRDGVTSVAISPDGKLVAAGSLDRIVRLWDAETGYIRDRFEGHSDSVYSVAFSPDGKWLASGSLDKTLKLWDLSGRARSRCRSTLSGHKDFVLSVAFSPDGNWLVSGSKDRAVQFWDPRTSITHMRLHGHKNSVISVALTGALDGSGGKFATGSGDFRARIWNYRVGNFERDSQSQP